MKKRLISMMLAIATAVSFTACSGVEANTSRTSSVESSSIAESTESTTSTTTDSKADSTTSTTESVTTSESSEPAEDKYEIKITDEKYGEKAYVVEGVRTVVKDGKTYTVGGEFDGGCVIDDVWLPEMRPEYPSGFEFICWDSIAEYYGVEALINSDTLYNSIKFSTDFYYDENGQLWGPSFLEYYVGDPKEKKIEICTQVGLLVLNDAISILLDKADSDYIMDDEVQMIGMNIEGDIFIDIAIKKIESKSLMMGLMKTNGDKIISWQAESTFWGTQTNEASVDAEYALVLGYYKDYIIVFHPETQKIVAYKYSEKYDPFFYANTLVKD